MDVDFLNRTPYRYPIKLNLLFFIVCNRMRLLSFTITIFVTAAGQRILTSSPLSIESPNYKFPGNSHGCGQLNTEGLSELTIDMSANACGGGTVQCPRCFILHNSIRLSIKDCQSPPRMAKCQETGNCPAGITEDTENRLNEYLFINLANTASFVGSDSQNFSSTYPSSESGSDSIAIPANSAKSGICYKNRFYWL